MKSMTPLVAVGKARITPTWRHISLVTSMVLVLFTTFVTTAPTYAAPVGHTSDTTTASSTPTPAPTPTSPGKNTHPAPANPHPYHGVTLPANADTSTKHSFTPTMQPLDLTLTPGVAVTARSSDSLLDVSVPSTTLASTDVTTLLGAAAPKGAVPHLIVTEIDPPSGSTAGSLITMGTYLLQVQDGKGHELASGKGLPHNITLTYHWPTPTSALALDKVVVSLNGALPMTTTVGHIGAKGHQPTTLHAAAVTGPAAAAATDKTTTTPSLTASIPLTASSTAASFTSNAPEGYFAKPDTFQNDLHTGDLTTQVPLDIPTGPGGLTPPLHLSYSSAAVSATHNVQAAAPWVGDGWNLDMGAITWSESLDDAMPSGRQWENSWSISDPYGTSSTLIPSSTDVSTFWDDTNNVYYNAGTYPHPVVQWHTAAESYAKIISYVGSAFTNVGAAAPCWRVWLTNGVMEEFGCTPDSLQWYPQGVSGTKYFLTAWKLDMIVDPSGNQIHMVYDQDMANSSYGIQYPRDVELNRIEWNSPACHNTQVACTGASWAPLYNVAFHHTDAVSHVYPGARSCGPQANNLRCDDPAAAGGSINIGTPTLTQTQVLNDLEVKVFANGAWNTLRNYQFQYDQGALSPNAIDDPGSGLSQSVSGFLLLDQVQETGTDQSTPHATGASANAYPAQVFKYTISSPQFYEDRNRYVANQPTDCGYTWNTGKLANGTSAHGCLLWSRSYNGFYMAEADNGEGLQQTFVFTNMHTNQHDPATGPDWTDPTVCNSQQVQGMTPAYPCDMPDDSGWSHFALTSKTVTENSPTSANANNQTTGTWLYSYHLAWIPSNECVDCGVSMYWGNTNSDDYQDYYNGQFRGFATVQQTNPDGGIVHDTFYTTEGWGVYDNTQVVACYNGHGGTGGCANENSPASDLTNAATGRLIEEDVTAPQSGSDWPLLSVTKNTWQKVCPPSGVTASPAVSFTAKNSLGTGNVTMNLNWDGNRVSESDPYNPMMVCDVQQASTDTYTPNGAITYSNRGNVTSSNSPYSHVANTYDTNYGHLVQSVTTGSDLTTTPTISRLTRYIWNDNITTTNTSATGTYIVDRVAATTMQDGNGTSFSCSYPTYDGAVWGFGAQSWLTKGVETEFDRYANCFNGSNYGGTGDVYSQQQFNANGDPLSTIDADAEAGSASHKATTGPCTGFTSCMGYDSTYGTLPTTDTNALNQTTTTHYTTTAAFGFGQWPSSVTDANGQATITTDDVLGRTLTTTKPGETAAFTTQLSYDVFCALTGPAAPCLEVDTTQQLGGSTTITKRDFYDGEGQHVESRIPAPGGQDVVQYALYDNEGRMTAQSQPYFVTAYIGGQGAAAYSVPDLTKPMTQTTYDSLGRVTITTDSIGKTTNIYYSIVCAPPGTNNDLACYNSVTTVDANSHKSANLTDALNRGVYDQSYTGNSSGTYALYRTTQAKYDVLGDKVGATYADGTHQSSATYDGLQHEIAFTDPDLGSYTLGYDANGNPTSSVDPRGASGTVYTGYDGLNRMLTRSTNSDGSNPMASYSYDSTASGNQGIGHLTGETFASGPSQSVTGGYSYVYDARGRQTGWTMTLGAASYPFTNGYNDAGQQTTLTYPDGDVVTTTYGAQDWLAGVTDKLGTKTTTLLNTLVYSGTNGASMKPTSAQVGNGAYQWSFGYDGDLRTQSIGVTLLSNSTTLFNQTRGYDAVGNVTSASTTLPNGTDNQVFCYDEQNRLVWAGASGTPTCNVTLTPGTLTAAQYSQTYASDSLNRQTTGPLGTGYTYGDSAHLDAVTAANGYTAAYDAAGNMTCRAYSGSGQTCTTGSQHGQPLTYDALRQLLTWQSSSSSSPSTESNVYNGEGQRVQTTTLKGGGGNQPSTTTFVGSYEEVTVASGVTTTTKYYQASVTQVISVNGSLSYLINDGLNSVDIEMGSSGNLRGQRLYAPYGAQRYSSGFFDTQHGFTGQYSDNLSGLNYDNARYYDPVAGQFISADYVQGPNRYTYVSNNPETTTDPSGNCPWCIGALIGAAVGAAVSYGSQVVSNVQQHGLTASAFTHVDAGAILKAAVTGAIIGAGGALLEGALGVGLGAKLFVGAATGAGGQMLDNAVNGHPLMQGVGMAALEGIATAGILHGLFHGGGARVAEDGGDAGGGGGGGGCNSFQGNTVVATPSGEQAIDTLTVGSTVLAYDSATGKAVAEPVQHVLINHDTNLVDVTIATSTNDKPAQVDATTTKQQDADVKAHGSQAPPPTTETLHTTTEHPFLTTDLGFVDAALLVPGEQVRQLDGSVGTVVAVKVTPGAGVRYNLTVQDLHTYAVGDGQWVVHNTLCTVPGNEPALNKDQILEKLNNPNEVGSQFYRANTADAEAAAKEWVGDSPSVTPDGNGEPATRYYNDDGNGVRRQYRLDIGETRPHINIERQVQTSPGRFNSRPPGLNLHIFIDF